MMQFRDCAKRRRFVVTYAFVAFALSGSGFALAQDKDALIENALSAAPPAIAETATVMDMKGEVLREGTGAYTCFPFEGPGTEAMCLDGEWMKWGQAWMEKKMDYKPASFGLAYMLAGDAPEGGASNIDPFAMEKTPDNQWVVEGPHVMILSPDPALLEDISSDPNTGAPYVMWKDTPFAHVMMPVGPRAE
jgi:hypothetical protein